MTYIFSPIFTVVIKNQSQTSSTMSDKVKNRLEQLDDFEEVSSHVYQSRIGIITNISEVHLVKHL